MSTFSILQSVSRKTRCSEDQRGITLRKWPHIIRLIVAQLTLVALIGGLFAQATPAHALSSSHAPDFQADGSVSYMAKGGEAGIDAGVGYASPYQLSTTLDVDIISTPWVPVDSNGEPGQLDGRIPKVFVVEAAITNTGSVAATDVVISLNYNPTGDWALLAAEDPVRTVNQLAVGETYYAYWFAGYPQVLPPDSNASHQYTVTASAANASQVASSQNFYEPNPTRTVQTRNTISTGNSGAVQSSADIVVGVELIITQQYDLGTNPGDITLSPVGNDDFDPSSYRLLTVQVRFFDDAGTQEDTITDRLYFPALEVPGFANNAEVIYTFIATVPSNTLLCPYAAINFDPAKYDRNFCSNEYGGTIPVTGTLSLSQTKQASSSTVEQGQLLTYTIEYANTGDRPLQYTWIWDDVPSEVSIVTSSVSPASDPSESTDGRVAWNLGTIPAAGQPGSTGSLTFAVLVDGNGQDLAHGTPLVNDAYFGINPDTLPQRVALTSTATSYVQAPTISVSKTDGRDIAGPGELLTYVLNIGNSGAIAATGVTITDTLPSDVTVAGTITPDPSSQDGQTLVWNDMTVPAGQTLVVSIPVSVASDVADGTDLVNTATVLHGNVAGHTYAEKTATDTTTAWVPQLTFTKTAQDVNGPRLVVGDTILYALRVTNTGTYTAQNVTVIDNLPDGVTYVDSSGDKGTVVESNGTVTWTIPELAAQSDNAANLIITVTIDDGTEGQTILNTGSVTSDNVPDLPDDPTPVCPDGRYPINGECETTPVPRDTELTFTKTAQDLNGSPIGIGDTILYTLQVTNTGTYTAFNVIVTDDLPDLVTCQAVSGDSAPPGCADPLVWTIPALAADAKAFLYVTVTIDEEAGGKTIVNSGSVTSINVPNPPDDPMPVCPDGSIPVDGVCPNTPVPGTSLALAKTAEDVDGPPLLVGDTIRYTLLVTNTGAHTAYNVTVTDDLPDQVTCQQVSGDSAPLGCADPLIWSIASLAPDTTAKLYIDVTINRGSEGQSITNTASVVGGNVPDPPPDPTPVCPDGSEPVEGICDNTPEPSNSFIFLPIVLNVK